MTKFSLKTDPAIRSFLNRMPEEIQETFTDEQLMHLKVAIGARQWGRHSLDYRGVFKAFKYRYYFVFLAGRNRRELTHSQIKRSLIGQSLFVSAIVCLFILLGLFIIYIIKSAAGIDIFSDYSFGIWAWFKSLFD